MKNAVILMMASAKYHAKDKNTLLAAGTIGVGTKLAKGSTTSEALLTGAAAYWGITMYTALKTLDTIKEMKDED